jgi:hypothetical protein
MMALAREYSDGGGMLGEQIGSFEGKITGQRVLSLPRWIF